MPSKSDTVTEKDVEKSAARVAKLREQVAEEEAAVRRAEASRHIELDKATLDAEGDRLEAQLAALKEQRKVSETPVSEDPVMRQVELGADAARIAAEEQAADEAEAARKAAEKENS